MDDLDSEDDYDYLSNLNSDLKTNGSEVMANKSSIDTESDDDCVVLEVFEEDYPLIKVKEEDKEVIDESVTQKSEPLDQKKRSLTEQMNAIKNDVKCDSKPKTETKDVKIFGKSREELEAKFDHLFKPSKKLDKWVSKQTNGSKDMKTESKTTETNEISIQTEDIDLNHLIDSNGSNLNSDSNTESEDNCCDSDEYILKAIQRVRDQHQKPNFARIYTQYKKLRPYCPQPGEAPDPEFIFSSAINDAIERKVIQKCFSKDPEDISYKPVNRPNKRQRMYSNSSSNDSNNSSVKRIRLSKELSEEKSIEKSDDLMNGINTSNDKQMSAQKDLGNLVSNEYIDINDIDVSSALVFGDTEIDPKLLDSIHNSSQSSLISKSLNSSPIKSFNHNKKPEVIEKSTICASNSSDTNRPMSDTIKGNDNNWLSETLPKYSPFIAQKGDRVVYLRDAHEIYINYELPQLLRQYPKNACTYEQILKETDDYIINAIVIDVKFYQINYIKFSVIRLKNLSINNDFEFNVLYRPNRGVPEFLVLDKFYNNPENNEWAPGSQFRSIWLKSWWIGVIKKKSIFNKQFPKSLFKCFEIQWNTGEDGRLSPWDLCQLNPNRIPKDLKNGILVTREDLLEINYRPKFDEWPEVYGLEFQSWRLYECKRIYSGIKFTEKFIQKSIIILFKDCKNPNIAYSLTFPIIKYRLKNMFYRRKESVISDINCLKMNCKLYIDRKELKLAEDFMDLILNIANDSKLCDEENYLIVVNQYKHLCQSTPSLTPPVINPKPSHRNSSDIQRSVPSLPSNHSKPTTDKTERSRESKKRRQRSDNQTPAPNEVKTTESTQWKEDSQKFIEDLLRNEKSLPYRQPVNPDLFPTYRTVISDPIDLSEIEDKLKTNKYLNPNEMRKDFRLMFINAKVFSKDPKSAMRKITKELSSICEDKLREIIVDWDRVYAYEERTRKQSGSKVREPTSRNQLWGYGAQQYY